MSDCRQCPSLQLYRLGQAYAYIIKAERILMDMDLLNSKIETDFFKIISFCYETIKELKLKEKT